MASMNSIYILLSDKDKRTYIGSTDNLERRLNEHNSGLCKSTKNRRPLRVIYTEEFRTLVEARNREKYFKSAPGRRKLKKIFNDFDRE